MLSALKGGSNTVGKVIAQGFEVEGGFESVFKILTVFGLVGRQQRGIQGERDNANKGLEAKLKRHV